MLHGRATGILALAALCSCPLPLFTAMQAPSLRVAAPTEGTYVIGPSRLVAMIDPPSRAHEVARVTFFADGRQVCTVARPPFECDWDAGDRVSEHQIRVVAQLASGGRLVETVRTRGVQYAEGVDVDVVQVTAVVTDDGKFVPGLRQQDFKVYQDDRPQPITSFASGTSRWSSWPR